jgi:hypothetical protein
MSDRPSDTSPEAWERYHEALDAMDPSDKLGLVFQLQSDLHARLDAGLRARYSNETDYQIMLRRAALYIDRKTMIRGYGWDPESNDPVPDKPRDSDVGAE